MIKRFQDIGYGFNEPERLFEGDPGLLSLDKLELMTSEFRTNQDLQLQDIDLFDVERAITPVDAEFIGDGVLTVDEAMKMANSQNIPRAGISSFHHYESERKNYTDFDFDYNLSHAEYDKVLIPQTDFLEKKIHRTQKESPIKVKPRVKTVKSEFEAEEIHRNFYQRVTNWKQAIHNKNTAKYFNNLQGQSKSEMEECSFHPKISDFKATNNQKIQYKGDKRADEKKVFYQQKQDEILTFKPKITNSQFNTKSKYMKKDEHLLSEFKECTFQPDISSSNGRQTNIQKKSQEPVFYERLNKLNSHQAKQSHENQHNSEDKSVTQNNKKLSNKTAEIDDSIFNSQNYNKVSAEADHSDFIRRQKDYENERQRKIAEMAKEIIRDIGTPIINQNSRKIFDSRKSNPIEKVNKQQYLGFQHKDDHELTFKPQISKYATEIERKAMNEDIHNVLYNDTERRRRDLDVATEINDKEIKKDCTFQPQICDNNSAHSKFKLELANYKQHLQDRDKVCKQYKEMVEEEKYTECTYHPQITELPEFIKKNLEDTKELRQEIKTLKELIKKEEKPRWIYA